MGSFKKLVGETAIYGGSTIAGRFLNWLLVPYYSHIFLTEQYGVVSNLYGYMAFLQVLLTYGLETGYFRFASKSNDKNLVYSTAMVSLFFTTLSFLLVIYAFTDVLSEWVSYPDHPEYIRWIGWIMALDTIVSIPFAKLRIESKAMRFALLKTVNIGINIFFNLFFLTICPLLMDRNPDHFVQYIYSDRIGIGYVFISNLIASLITLVMLFPEMRVKLRCDRKLLRSVLSYSFPILIMGIAGQINLNIDKILIPKLIQPDKNPLSQLGIYSAGYKLAVLMNMFIQAFRYAFEPFFFSRGKSENEKIGYALILKYFSLFGLVIFLGISLFLDVFKLFHIIHPDYYEGLKVVPIMLMANLFTGIYYTLSLWYKLTDKTRFGAYFAVAGALISLAMDITLIPVFGYMAAAYAILISQVVMAVLSYVYGQKHYPINYPAGRISLYFGFALLLYLLSEILKTDQLAVRLTFHFLLLLIFLVTVYSLENKEFRKFLH